METYDPLRQLAEDLWVVDGDWSGSPFRRRMTILRLAGGRLLLHSAIAMAEPDLRDLERLGQVSVLVVPNSLHDSEPGYYIERYPLAKLFAPAEHRARLARRVRVDGDLERGFYAAVPLEVRAIPLRGTRIHEVALVHRPSRTLVLTDVVFNLRGKASGVQGLFRRLNGIEDRFGPSRLFRAVFLSDPAAFRRSLDRVMEEDFDRVIMSHGEVLERGGKQAMREAFEWLGEVR